jgi:hypothetical protein
VLSRLPAAVPAPGYVGQAQVPAGQAGEFAWQIMVSDALPGRMPLPWTETALDAVHTACVASARALTPPPPGFDDLPTMVTDYAHDLAIVGALPAMATGELTLVDGQPGWLRGRLADLQALVELAEVALVGSTACHCDLRADHLDSWPALIAAYLLAYAPRPLWPGGLRRSGCTRPATHAPSSTGWPTAGAGPEDGWA